MKKSINNIGIEELEPPKGVCSDKNCPWHGKIKVRGKLMKGVVVSAKVPKTAIVQIDYLHYIPKYERYERRSSKIAVHNPECIKAKEGDLVLIGETRPISKTKHFVVLQILKKGEKK